MTDAILEAVADAIDAARYAHPDHPRERPRAFRDADASDREYATRLAKAVLGMGASGEMSKWEKGIREKVFDAAILSPGEWVYLVGVLHHAKDEWPELEIARLEGENERLREQTAFVHAQMNNGCAVDAEPCTPIEFCKCAEDAKARAPLKAAQNGETNG